MHKKVFFAIAVLGLLSIVLAACSIKDSAALASGPSVHMGASNFIQSTITITKGDTLTLIDDSSSPHIIVNGYWEGSTQHPEKEPGAPTVNLNFTGNDTHTTPPFNTAGTFKLYCTIHGGMNLTVTVK
jgi:plastocyanin